MAHQIHTNTTTERWWQDRRFKCTTTTMCIFETSESGEQCAYQGLKAHTDTFMSGWIIYDFGKYESVTTEDAARAELLRRHDSYMNSKT